MKKRKKAGILRQNAISEIREERFCCLSCQLHSSHGLAAMGRWSDRFYGRLPQVGIAIWLVNLMNRIFSYLRERKAEKATLGPAFRPAFHWPALLGRNTSMTLAAIVTTQIGNLFAPKGRSQVFSSGLECSPNPLICLA